jgi:hypothetical protein
MEEAGLKAVAAPVVPAVRVVRAVRVVPAHIQSLELPVSSFLKYQRFQDEAQP